ncbi:MAG TPA: hypothetical protein VMH27_00670 [Puia sp.]|nr:hypothetical protein [Puia sp.]
MSLNTIQLPDFVVRELYKDALLPAEAPALTAPGGGGQTPAVAGIRYLGDNRRQVTLVVHAPGSSFLPDAQLSFVAKLLQACQMTLADVAIVNYAATEVNIGVIKDQLHPKTVLLFGTDPTAIRLPLHFPIFKPIDYDSCKFLSAPGLEQLVANTEESRLLKSKLWVCLKTIFDV